MKKLMFALAAAVLFFSGCAHTSTLQWSAGEPGQLSNSGKKVLWNLTAVNNGMYLFYFIPLWSGHPTHPNRHEYELFQHLLTRPKMRMLLDDKLRELEADSVEDITYSESSSGMLGLWIIWKRSMTAHGVAVKKNGK